MTPIFVSPCYVQVEDKSVQKALYERLSKRGYGLSLGAEKDWGNIIVAQTFGIIENTRHELKPSLDHHIDCGTCVPLFFALATRKITNDYGQWFTDR